MEPIVTLSKNLDVLSRKDREFAESLLASRTLSTKQHYWIGVLAERATKPAPAPVEITVGDLTSVLAMFDAAREHKQFPKISLALPDGRPVVLAVAGPNASRPGTINVTDGGKFGSNVWYGRVTPEGTWERSGKADGETATSIAALLTRFAAEPLAVAAEYGHATHRCCFCRIKLTDARSKAAGYGPVCATNHGLAWG